LALQADLTTPCSDGLWRNLSARSPLKINHFLFNPVTPLDIGISKQFKTCAAAIQLLCSAGGLPTNLLCCGAAPAANRPGFKDLAKQQQHILIFYFRDILGWSAHMTCSSKF
jgi:hypothetical protein